MPLFSIIIPVYNVQNYLSACVKSVVEQPGPRDWECILVDDGSTDQSGAMCDALAAERREHFVMRRPKGILGEGRGAEPVLVGGQHEVEPEARERLQGGDGSGHEREFFEAVDLFVGGFGDDRAVAVDEEGFFHNRKFLTVSIIRAFSAGVPTVMRRHPSQPGMRERLRTMTPAEISASYMRSGSGVRTRMKLASEG